MFATGLTGGVLRIGGGAGSAEAPQREWASASLKKTKRRGAAQAIRMWQGYL